MRIIEGISIALLCPVTGIMLPTVEWSHNGSVVNVSDPHINITQRTDQNDASIQVSILTIMTVMSSDNGNYECTASNNVINGTVTASVTLVVFDVG